MLNNKHPQQIQTMFNNIANDYDFCNNIISMFLHNFVKKYSVKQLNIKPNSDVLDFCCGTGDMGMYVKQLSPSVKIIGIDFSKKMLNIAKDKNQSIQYVLQDVTNMNFKDSSFDYVIESFGLRNIKNRRVALNEIYRVIKPEGYFLHLDFNGHGLLSDIFNSYILYSMKFFAHDNFQAYKYLTKSIKKFPNSSDFIKEVEKHNFHVVINKKLLFGIISLQIYKKSSS